jgi:hypothetical protein
MSNLTASANAAVAENARLMIDSDGVGRIVLPARREPFGETRIGDAIVVGQGLKLAIAGFLLAGARRRVIRHQQFDDGSPRANHFFRIGANHHFVFGGAHAGGCQNSAAGIHEANAANSDGSFILLVAEGGDRDAIQTRGIEDGGTSGHGNCMSIDGQCDIAHIG